MFFFKSIRLIFSYLNYMVLDMLNRLLGSVSAMVLYPIKSVLVNLVMVFVAPAFLSLHLLLRMASKLRLNPDSIFVIFAIAFTNFFLSLLFFVPLLPIILVLGVIDFFKSIYFGAVDGFRHGLFWHVLKRTVTDFLVFSTILRFCDAIIDNIESYFEDNNNNVANEEEEEDANDNNFNAHEQNFINQAMNDIPEDLNNDNDNENNNIEVVNENEVEVPLASLILREEQGPTVPYINGQPDFDLSPNEKIQAASSNKRLKDLLGRYEALYNRLKAVDDALDGKGEMPDDEITIEDIQVPSLFIKEYSDNNIWMVVPGSTLIVDQKNLDPWFAQSSTHPTQQDNVNAPDSYEQKPTRYKYLFYRNMHDAQELREIAASIRENLAQLNHNNNPSSPESEFSFADNAVITLFNKNDSSQSELDIEHNQLNL